MIREPNSPEQATTTTTQQQQCCSFEMIRASFQQDWASRGCFRYTWTTRHPKPACTEQGLLISVRSGLIARAAAATHQSSRPACRRVPTGPGPTSHGLVSHSRQAQHYWSPTAWNGVSHRIRGAPPVRKLACSQHSHVGCATSLRTAFAAPRNPKAQTPEQGQQGRNNSRCAGITR